MERQLTDGESYALWVDYEIKRPLQENFANILAQAQDIHTLKWVVEWGNETCPHDLGEGTYCYRHACDICWQELKDLAGG